ncbi:MAG TPA: hypothetical protein PKC83_08350 [Gemmatimonadaceae bacterium]|nr:hypothetical protein [Gemmatimonadaceae bacterium]
MPHFRTAALRGALVAATVAAPASAQPPRVEGSGERAGVRHPTVCTLGHRTLFGGDDGATSE